MNIKFWDAGKDYLRHKEEIDAALQRVLSAGELVLGFSPDITKFEEDFAKYVGARHAIMCGAGTQALYLAYRGAGIGGGDEVITVSHTFAATFDQIVAVGATPLFVDIGDDGLMDVSQIENLITPRTKAIVPVHLEGKVCDMEAINTIARKHNLLVIEDAAQALGASIGYVKAGNLADISCFSLFPAKMLGSVGNAGMVTTNDDELAQRIRMLRCNYNLGKNQDREAEYGVNMEPDNIQAAVLNVKFPHHDANIARRAAVAKMYDEGLAGLPLHLAVKQDGRVYQDYVIRVNCTHGTRDELAAHLKENGVGILGHTLIPHHEYHKLDVPFLPNTDRYIKTQIRIPCNTNVTDEEVAYVIKTIRAFYEK